MGLSPTTMYILLGGFLLVTLIGFLLNQLRIWLNTKLNKYGITVGKKDDNGQK